MFQKQQKITDLFGKSKTAEELTKSASSSEKLSEAVKFSSCDLSQGPDYPDIYQCSDDDIRKEAPYWNMGGSS
jgi:hypothetical protein